MRRTENEEDDFFSRIEKKFNQLRGTPLLVSPNDWALMAEWKKRGIPAVVIIEALERGFEKTTLSQNKKRGINSLSYFRRIVEDCWESFQQLNVGRGETKESEEEADTIIQHIRSLALLLDELSARHSDKKEITALLKDACNNLNLLILPFSKGTGDIEKLEEELARIEDVIGKTLLEHTSDDQLSAAWREAEDAFSHLNDSVNEKQLHDIKSRFVMKKLRKKYGIPRISLFFR